MEQPFNISYLLARNKPLAEMLIPGDDGYRIKGKNEKNLPLTRDLWEDIIHMKELFLEQGKKPEMK